MCRSPGAGGAASRLWRRYADAPAAALLTGRTAAGWPALRSGPYALFFHQKLTAFGPPGASQSPCACSVFRTRRVRGTRGIRDGLEVERVFRPPVAENPIW